MLLSCGALQPVLAAELATLFTTPQERRLIDRNRYKQVEMQPEPPAVVEGEVIDIDDAEFSLEQVTREYRVSGITLSQEGPHMAWINGKAYEDGAMLDDGSRIQVLTGDQIRVRITAPDGKHYLATSGETVEISLLVPAPGD